MTGDLGPSTNRAPSWSFPLPSDTTAECSLLRDGVVLRDWASCAGTFGIDLTGSADGRYVLSVRLTDLARNTGTPGNSAPYVLDTTAPLAPVVTGPGGPSRDRSPSVTFSGETGTTAQCRALLVGAPPSSFAPCTSPWRPVLGGDGTWTAEVRLTDAAGNTGPVASSEGWYLDTVAPEAPVVAAPRSPGRDTVVTWSITAEGGASLTCRLTAPAGTVPDWAPCVSPFTTPLTGPDGLYVLEVAATDAAGGTSASGRADYLLDTTPPTAPALTVPSSPSSDRAPSFAFTPAPGDTAACRLTRGPAVLQEWAVCTSPAVLDLAGLPDGAYTLAVRYTDAAGGTGPITTSAHVLDTTAPDAPVLVDLPASPNPARAPRFGFTAEADAASTCRVRRVADDLLLSDRPCTSPYTLDLGGQPAGSYRLTVRATDRAGNTSEPAVAVHVLDAAAAPAPVLTGPASPSPVRSATWSISATGPTECRLSRGSTVVVDWKPCSGSYTADLTTGVDGTYQLSARSRDAAGRLSGVATSRYVLDTAGAALATITAPPSPSSARTPVWVLSAGRAAIAAQCRVLAGGGIRQDWAPCAVSAAGEPFTLDLEGAADGSYVLVVRLLGATGTPGGEQRSEYVLDTLPPGPVRVTDPPSPNSDPTPTWFVAGEAGTTLSCRLTAAGGVVVKDATVCGPTYTPDLAGRPDGAYTLSVHAVDAAGNSGPDHSSVYEFDSSAPLAPSAVVGPTGPSVDRQPRWTFVREQGTRTTCTVTRGPTVIRSGACESPFVLDLTGAPDGTYTLSVRAVDNAGNAGPAGLATYVLDTTPPKRPTAVVVPGSPSSTTAPRWAWATPADATSQCRTTAAGTVLLDWAGCASPWTAAFGTRPDGAYGFDVRAVDKAGNTSDPLSAEYRLDRTAAPLVDFASTPPHVSADETPSWSLLVDAAQTVQCRLSGPDSAGGWASCGTGRSAGAGAVVEGGSYTAQLQSRPDGQYVLEVRGLSTAGVPGPVSRALYLLDRRPAQRPSLTSGPQGQAGRDPRITWTWDAVDDATFECRLTRDRFPLAGDAGTFTPCGTSRSIDLTGLADATYVLEVRSRDAAGNLSDPALGTYRYDTTPPDRATVLGRPVLAVGGRTVSWVFAQGADTVGVCTVTFGGEVVADQQRCSGGFSVALDGRGPGTYELGIVLHDSAGNTSPPARSSYVSTASAAPPRVVDTQPVPDGVGPPAPGGGAVGPIRGPVGGGVVDVPRAGPVAQGGPGTPVAIGPPLVPVGRVVPVFSPPRELPTPLETVGRTVTRIPEALPEIDLLSPNEVPAAIGRVFEETLKKATRQPTLPLAVLAVVAAFLLVQNRIDRRDPKLAAAPVEAEPELDFGPVLRLRGPGGAPA